MAVDACTGEDCWVCKLEQRSASAYEEQRQTLPAPRQREGREQPDVEHRRERHPS